MTRVSFRELVPEIRDTGYLTHAIFAYPAKFIPQVVRYAIDTLAALTRRITKFSGSVMR